MRVIVSGAYGRMGKELVNSINGGYLGATLAAEVDINADNSVSNAYKTIDQVDVKVDVIVDFSHHSATADLVRYAVDKRIPLVIATTGQTDEEKAIIENAAHSIPIFYSGNMSIGIALLIELAKRTAKVFPDADVEIVEVHHNQKLDVPSGTAQMIADAVRGARGEGDILVGRRDNGKRPHGQIGVHSLRLGKVIGEHEVRIDTGTQSITLRHEAHSRALFAEGALTAAAYICGRDNGMYNVSALLTQ